MRPLCRVLWFVLVGVLAAACAGGGGASSEGLEVVNGDWRLVSGTGPAGEVAVGDGVEVTLTVDGGSWGGNVCNHYGAQDVAVDDGSVTIGDVVRTEMACADPRLMNAEDAYLAAFTDVTAYEVAGDTLTLTGDGIELVYERIAPVASPRSASGSTRCRPSSAV